MKYLFILLLALPVYANQNLPDKHDQNETPAKLEKRKHEEVNIHDRLDKNKVPDVMEEREKQEEWRKSYEEEQYDYNPRK